MAVKIRLMRMGKRKQPTYRVVVADARFPRDGRFIERIGRYDPRQDPSVIEIDSDRALHWLEVGAQPTERVQKLLEISGAWARFRATKGDVHQVGDSSAAEATAAEEPTGDDAAEELDSGTAPTGDDAAEEPDSGAESTDSDTAEEPEK